MVPPDLLGLNTKPQGLQDGILDTIEQPPQARQYNWAAFISTSMRLSNFHKYVNAIEQLHKHVNVIEQLPKARQCNWAASATPFPYPLPLLNCIWISYFWYSFCLHLFFYSFDYTVKSGGVCNRLPVPCRNTTLSCLVSPCTPWLAHRLSQLPLSYLHLFVYI